MSDTPTAEEIAQHYSAAMDSVNLINALMAQDSRNDEETDTVARNVEHLQIMVAKDFWTIFSSCLKIPSSQKTNVFPR